MSQFPPPLPGGYPNPYAPMNPYGANPGTPRPACRAAAILQIFVGSMIALLSFCLGLGGYLVTTGRLPTEGQSELMKVASTFGMTLQQLLVTMGVCVFIPALLFIVLGIFVWRGVRWIVMASMVLTCLSMLWLLINLVDGVVRTSPAAICLAIVPLALMVVLVVLLFRAWRETGAGSGQAQYQAQLQQYYQQYYQYQQMQQGAQPLPRPASPPPTPGTGSGPAQDPPPPPFR